MALTEFQLAVCRLIARERIRSGVSYVAGGVALNALTNSPRISRDIDVFHDTREAVEASWAADRRTLERAGFHVRLVREREAFVEATVWEGAENVTLQWALDSAFRFFPLIEHDDLGLALHPFDLATNKVLALVGRLEARDWVDTIQCHRTIQPLGYLAWAASAKDPGFGPGSILEQAGRTARYSVAEVSALSFSDSPPDAAELSRTWHGILAEAWQIIAALPAGEVGRCVVDPGGELFAGGPEALPPALEAESLRFHEASLRGAWPRIL